MCACVVCVNAPYPLSFRICWEIMESGNLLGHVIRTRTHLSGRDLDRARAPAHAHATAHEMSAIVRTTALAPSVASVRVAAKRTARCVERR